MKPVKLITDSIKPLSATPENIRFELFENSLGTMLVAVTKVGPCLITFVEKADAALEELNRMFPGTSCVRGTNDLIKGVQARLLGGGLLQATPMTFHIKGTDFQLRVWQELLQIPWGQTLMYGELAARIGHPTASRAVGNAVGANPIFCLIPCHRVIRSNGSLGNYRWGTEIKQMLLESEAY